MHYFSLHENNFVSKQTMKYFCFQHQNNQSHTLKPFENDPTTLREISQKIKFSCNTSYKFFLPNKMVIAHSIFIRSRRAIRRNLRLEKTDWMIKFLWQNITFKMDENALPVSARIGIIPKPLFFKIKHSVKHLNHF